MRTLKDNIKEAIGRSLDAYNKKYGKALHNRIDNIVAQAGTDNTEIVDARVDSTGKKHTTLNNRINEEFKKGKEHQVTITASHITVEDGVESIIEDIELYGNTVQNPSNLSDIKSVGVDNGDGTYSIDIVTTGRNMCQYVEDGAVNSVGALINDTNMLRTNYIRVSKGQLLYYKWLNSSQLENAETWVCMYDINKKFKAKSLSDMSNHIGIDWDGYVVFYRTKNTLNGFMLSHTPLNVNDYEPYKESKCSIKLPCQLKKVGDIADRLYFDKVENAWCIEKNIFIKSTRDLDYKPSGIAVLDKTYRLGNVRGVENDARVDMYGWRLSMCSRFPFIQGEYWTRDEEHYYLDINNGALVFFVNKSECGNRKEDVVKYMQDIDAKLYLVYKEPKKIVLPLDTQIILNQFLGTTHVFLECGEVEGTIKATFSKSMAGTVQSNTQAIRDMDNRVKDIEGLKESQDMAYSTDKGYLVCKETKNGTVKDLKISGKSLKNIAQTSIFTARFDNGFYQDKGLCPVDKIEIDKVYTFVIFAQFNNGHNSAYSDCEFVVSNIYNGANAHPTIEMDGQSSIVNSGFTYPTTNGSAVIVKRIKFKDFKGFKYLGWRPCRRRSQWVSGEFADYTMKVLLLEGDHTQNPPTGYFEGIASVGDGADKIEVSSMNNGNILNSELIKAGVNGDTGKLSMSSSGSGTVTQQEIIPVVPNMKLYYKSTGERTFRGGGNTFLYKYGVNNEYLGRDTCVTFNPIDIPSNCYGVRVAFTDFELSKDYPAEKYGVVFSQFENFVDTPAKQDKKPILFKDTDGTLKPIKELRGLDTVCDTIELHNDGKYYYHQRTSKSVLNGGEAEKWFRYENVEILTKTYTIKLADTIKRGGGSLILCDKFKYVPWDKFIVDSVNYISHVGTNHIYITHNESTSVELFKQWLQTNPITVITELAEEKVFEVNPLFLKTYEGETMISVDGGAVSPLIDFKITSYITSLVLLNQQRISLIEDQMTNMFKAVLSGDMRTLAETIYPEDFNDLDSPPIMLLK